MGEDNIITIPCTLDRYNRKKDRSVTLAFTSLLEISNEEFSVIDTFHQQSGHLLFRRNSFTNEDIPTEDVETDIAKSQATQCRDALWVLYRAKGYKSEYKNDILYGGDNSSNKDLMIIFDTQEHTEGSEL